MNKTFQEADDLIADIKELLDSAGDIEAGVILCPSFPFLELATDLVNNTDIKIGAQNVSAFASGAYTGEVSAEMLASMEVDCCIIGHSERRQYFRESDKQISKKASMLLKNDITPIFCCGETLKEREAEKQFEVVRNQINEALFSFGEQDIQKFILAYEPVWAIGTGVTASPDQAQEMHAFIRSLIAEKYSSSIAGDIIVLYGGSCNPKNAKTLFANNDVDGGLIGGASLNSEDFVKVIRSF